jgi:DNA-directed RNA polymerase subunit RPC12/RpoP
MKQINKPIHKQGHCPICDSKDLIHDQPRFYNVSMTMSYRCFNCQNEGIQEYLLNYVGAYVVNQNTTETFVNVGDETIGETK